MSDGLLGIFRLLRALHDRLPASRDELAPQAHDVSLVYLEQVEGALGVELPNDVVALATLRIPVLVRACGLRIETLSAPTRDCAGEFGAPRGWVAVASFAEKAMPPGADLGYDSLLCISRAATREGEPDVRVTDASGSSPKAPLSTFLRERLSRRYNRTDDFALAASEAKNDTRPLDDAFVVRVVDDHPRAAPVVRVRHVKFGVGTIVRADGDKVEVAFESGERKTLVRKFVEEL